MPSNAPEPMFREALAELLQMGLGVARVAARLAEVEGRAVEALAEAADATARGVVAAPDSLAQAIEAGRMADASDAARDAVAARLASIIDSFDRAARAVRRTVALARRLELRPYGEPVRAPASRERVRQEIVDGVAAAIGRGAPEHAERLYADLAERMDAPELDDEIGERPAEEIIQDICRDLGVAVPGGAAPLRRPTPAATRAFCARAARPAAPAALKVAPLPPDG